MNTNCYKKLALLIVTFTLFISPKAIAEKFSANPEQINNAAKSVMMLEIYDKNGTLNKTGSGFVAFDNRHLVTNYHVTKDADMIYAYSDSGDLYIIMDVCIADSKKDIAILQFFSPTDLHPLDLNETGEVLRGSAVVAIGSPKGFSNTVSTGVVSAYYKENGVSYIQFSAPISSGSSGGALFDDEGKVIGITTSSYDDGFGISQNLNFAVNIVEVFDLYRKWDGNVSKLSELRQTDINTPTDTPAPKKQTPDIGNPERVSANRLNMLLDSYNHKLIELNTSMEIAEYSFDGDDLIVIGFGDNKYVSCVFKDYKLFDVGNGNNISQIIKRIKSFTVIGTVSGGTSYKCNDKKGSRLLYIPVIKVDNIEYIEK